MNIYASKSNQCLIHIACYQGYNHIKPNSVVMNMGGGFNDIIHNKEEICHCPKQSSEVHLRIIGLKD
jgi:hypothetical protein